MYIVLEADIPTLMENLASMKDDRLKGILATAKEKSTSQNEDFFTVFEQDVKADGIKLSRYYHQYGASLDDIMLTLKEEADDAINRVLEILQNRVDQFGVSEPTIQKQGKHRIVVELAGIQDSERARALLQSTALLEFYLVKNAAVTNEIIAQLDDVLKEKTDETELQELASGGQPKTFNLGSPTSYFFTDRWRHVDFFVQNYCNSLTYICTCNASPCFRTITIHRKRYNGLTCRSATNCTEISASFIHDPTSEFRCFF